MSRLTSSPGLRSGADGKLVGDDLLQPFQIEDPGLRGRLVRLGPSVDRVLSAHAYPEPVATLLGETLALAVALAGALKFDGVFTLQTRGDGPISMLVADVTSGGDLRGYASFDAQRLAAAVAGPIEAPVPRLLGAGHLAFTVDQGSDTDRYQGIVELIGATLADCVHHYFRQSEQLQAAVRLACGRPGGQWRAGALMLQRLPAAGGIRVPRDLAGDGTPDWDDDDGDDDWRRSLLLMGSSTVAELIDPDLSPSDLLFRLFHEDGVRVYPVQPVRAGCRCSRERVVTVLGALPRDEVESLKVDDRIEVTCEFCNTRYVFSDADLAAIYAPK